MLVIKNPLSIEAEREKLDEARKDQATTHTRTLLNFNVNRAIREILVPA